MSPDWSILAPGVIIAVVAGIAIGGTIDLGRRLAELRARKRRFEADAPGALAAAHEALVGGIPKDPSSLVPADAFVKTLRDQTALLQVGSQQAKSRQPAIAMLDGMNRLLEELAVRGRALDGDITAVFSEGRTDAETRFMLKLTRQALQRDPQPAEPVPEIDSEPVNAVLQNNPELVARIVRYRRLQERLHNVADQFVEHWWVVRGLRLDGAARAAREGLTGSAFARWRTARAIDREVHDAVVADFRPRWEGLTQHLR